MGNIWHMVASHAARIAQASKKIIILAVQVVGVATIAWIVWPHIDRRLTPETFGHIIVDSPEVYTRERLVNDRLQQASWLEKQIGKTDENFRSLNAVVIDTHRSSVEAGLTAATIGAQTSPEAPDQKESAPDSGNQLSTSALTVSPTTLDEFRAMNSYRDVIRAERMQAALDDRHDIEGNTVYYLTFDASIIAGSRSKRYAAVQVNLSQNSAESRADYTRLYEDWQRYLTRLVDQNINNTLFGAEFDSLFESQYAALYQYFQWRLCPALLAAAGLNLTEPTVPNELCLSAIYEYRPRPILPKSEEAGNPQADVVARFIDAALESYIDQVTEFLEEHARAHYTSRLVAAQRNLEDSPKYEVAKYRCGRNAPAPTVANPPTRMDRPIPTGLSGDLPRGPMAQAAPICPPTLRSRDLIYALIQLDEWLAANPQSVPGIGTRTNFNGLLPEYAAPVIDAAVLHLAQLCSPRRSVNDECIPIPEDPEKLRCAIVGFQKQELERQRSKMSSSRHFYSFSDFFDFKVVGGGLGKCTLSINLKSDFEARRFAMEQLISELNQDFEVYSYGVTPKNLVQQIATGALMQNRLSMHFASRIASEAGGVDGQVASVDDSIRQMESIQTQPIIVGFGSRRPAQLGGRSHLSRETAFGWIFSPQLANRDLASGDSLHRNEQYTLSAIVSVPSWWRSVRISTQTCWVFPEDLPELQEDNFQLCPENSSSGSTTEPDYYVRLPGAVNELSRKLRFEVVQEPYISLPRSDHENQVLTIGKPGTLLFEGGRLWRSTTVTLGSQTADEVTVLPNMEGIIAKFDCVGPPAKVETSQNSQLIQGEARVWTSEGVTKAMRVFLRPSSQPAECPAEP